MTTDAELADALEELGERFGDAMDARAQREAMAELRGQVAATQAALAANADAAAELRARERLEQVRATTKRVRRRLEVLGQR